MHVYSPRALRATACGAGAITLLSLMAGSALAVGGGQVHYKPFTGDLSLVQGAIPEGKPGEIVTITGDETNSYWTDPAAPSTSALMASPATKWQATNGFAFTDPAYTPVPQDGHASSCAIRSPQLADCDISPSGDVYPIDPDGTPILWGHNKYVAADHTGQKPFILHIRIPKDAKAGVTEAVAWHVRDFNSPGRSPSYDTNTKDKDGVLRVKVVGAPAPDPVAVDHTYSVAEGKNLHVSSKDGVLAGDQGDGLSASVAKGVTHGTLRLSPDGSFDYRPAAKFHGSDGFTYTATDTRGHKATAQVKIKVDAAPAPSPTPTPTPSPSHTAGPAPSGSGTPSPGAAGGAGHSGTGQGGHSGQTTDSLAHTGASGALGTTAAAAAMLALGGVLTVLGLRQRRRSTRSR